MPPRELTAHSGTSRRRACSARARRLSSPLREAARCGLGGRHAPKVARAPPRSRGRGIRAQRVSWSMPVIRSYAHRTSREVPLAMGSIDSRIEESTPIDFDAALGNAVGAARRTFPTFCLPPDVFVAYLRERLPPDLP